MNHIKLLINAGIYHFIDIEFCCKIFMPVLVMMVEISMVIYFHKIRFPYHILIFPHLQTQKGSLKVKVKNQINIEANLFFLYFYIIYTVPSKEKLPIKKHSFGLHLDVFMYFFIQVFYQ